MADKQASQSLGFGGPDGPKRPDGGTFKFTPFAPVSQKNSSDAITRNFLDSLVLEYRFINAVTPDMTTELFGESFPSPILAGGMSASVTRLREGGMPELARGVLRAGAPMLTGYLSGEEFEKVCDTGVRAIRIIKPQADNEVVLKDIAHDEACGAFAFALDIDHVFGPDGYPCPRGGPDYGDLAPKSTEELKMLISSTKLPCIVKGVLSVHDAKCCVEAGASAILLSHHKGELPCAVPPAFLVPEIRQAVGGQVKILVDCGITSGLDAFKVLAQGADAVCVARNLIPSYMKEGADGVTKRFRELNDELRACMARTCTADVHHFDPTTVRRKMW